MAADFPHVPYVVLFELDQTPLTMFGDGPFGSVTILEYKYRVLLKDGLGFGVDLFICEEECKTCVSVIIRR